MAIKKLFLLLCCPGLLQADDAPGFHLGGFFHYRYEWTQNPRAIPEDSGNALYATAGNAYTDAKDANRVNLWITVDRRLRGGTRFHAVVSGEHLAGRTPKTFMDIKEVYAADQVGPLEVQLGRFLTSLGLGTIGSSPFNDGIHLLWNGPQASAQAYLTRFGNQNSAQIDTVQQAFHFTSENTHMTLASGDLKWRPRELVTLSAAVCLDVTSPGDKALYREWALGAEARLPAPFTLSGEFARNHARGARQLNRDLFTGTSAIPNAWYARVKYRGAAPDTPRTYGCALQYRHADSGFDIMSRANPSAWNVPFNWSSPSQGGNADNHRGFELGGEATLRPGVIFKAAYGWMRSTRTTTVAAVLAHRVGGPVTTGPMADRVPRTDQERYFTAQAIYLF